MADEKIVTDRPVETAPGTHTTTIIRESRSSGGGTGMVFAVILLIAVIGGIYLFNRTSASESVKDSAVAEAAGEVGNAASKVGNAAENAADSVTK